MKFIQGKDRKQSAFFPVSVDNAIDADNEVRAIDAFVDSLDVAQFGFKVQFPENGRPAYHPTVLLKLFIYGYMNRIRSSRGLEKECKRNIEVMWLLSSLTPDHNTIANFRKDNPKAIKKVFRATVNIAKHFDLIGGKLIAGDSTKLRAQNSKKNNYNKKKIERHLQYIDNKLEDYNKALAQADSDEQKQQINDDIGKQKARKKNYQNLEKQLDESGQKQISTTDPDSRQIVIRNNITEVAYNVQATTDAKHCLPIDYQVTNSNDSKAMGGMLKRAKSVLGNNRFTALFDKGYYTGTELKIAQDLGIHTLVAEPKPASHAPDPRYNVIHFIYDETGDCYICPEQNQLTTNGSIYIKNKGKSSPTSFKQYKTKACKNCHVRQLCTSNKIGKLIERNTLTPVFERNRKNVLQNPELYKRRQAIVEHPFGTIKRQWGFDHIMSKQGINRASADVGLIFTAYNLRRLINIIGLEKLKAFMASLIRLFFKNTSLINPFRVIFSFLKRKLQLPWIIQSFYPNPLYLT